MFRSRETNKGEESMKRYIFEVRSSRKYDIFAENEEDAIHKLHDTYEIDVEDDVGLYDSVEEKNE